MKKLTKLIRISIGIILSAILAINIWLIATRLIFQQDLPKVMGYSQAVVLSGSMEPYFSAGDVVIFKTENNYQIGDVVIFPHGNTFVTHRIVEKENNTFITKGDANNAKDKERVNPQDIEGKVVGVIPNIGHIQQFFISPLGILILIVLGIAIVELPYLLDKIRRK